MKVVQIVCGSKCRLFNYKKRIIFYENNHSLIPSALPPVIIRQSRNRERERKGEAMRILPKKESVMMVYPLIVGQYIISVGQAMPSILLLILTVSVIVCLILDIRFLAVQFKKLMGGK